MPQKLRVTQQKVLRVEDAKFKQMLFKKHHSQFLKVHAKEIIGMSMGFNYASPNEIFLRSSGALVIQIHSCFSYL